MSEIYLKMKNRPIYLIKEINIDEIYISIIMLMRGMVIIMNTNVKSGRIRYIDIAKGIGILLVVVGHMDLPSFIVKLIFVFHMPLFMFLSGMVFSEKKIKHNILNLLNAYICIGLIMNAVYGILQKSLSTFTTGLICLAGGGGAPHFYIQFAPAMWFITALIVVEILYYVHKRYLNDSKIFLACCIGLGVVMTFFKENSYIPWNIDVALLLYPYFWVGGLWKKYNYTISKINSVMIPIGLILMITVLIGGILNGSVNIFMCLYGRNIILYYINGFMGSVLILIISIIIDKIGNVLGEALQWLGSNTIVLMCTHQMVFMYMSKLLPFGTKGEKLLTLVIELCMAIIIAIITTIIIKKYFPWCLKYKARKQ